MSQFALEQLNKCTVAQIPNCDDGSIIVIPKTVQYVKTSSSDLIVNHKYKLHLDISVVKPCDWYYTIHNNWNNGNGPKDEYVYAKVLQVMGKMIKLYSIGEVTGLPWEGWIPLGNIKVLNYDVDINF